MQENSFLENVLTRIYRRGSSYLTVVQKVVPTGYMTIHTIFDNTLIFASELKAIFKYPGIEKIVDSQGICELFGIGPSHTPGTTVFKNIFELYITNAKHCLFTKIHYFPARIFDFASYSLLGSSICF